MPGERSIAPRVMLHWSRLRGPAADAQDFKKIRILESMLLLTGGTSTKLATLTW